MKVKNKTMDDPSQVIEFADRSQWREWLRTNHQQEGEAWLLIYKSKYHHLGLDLSQAVEEALCFGWIDSTLKPINEQSYALRFSPRRSNSIWSVRNIERIETLISEGRMTESGMIMVNKAKDSGEWQAAIIRERVDIVPPDLEEALQKHEGALEAYRELSDSRKKQFIYWLQSAKRDITRQRRIQKIIEQLSGD